MQPTKGNKLTWETNHVCEDTARGSKVMHPKAEPLSESANAASQPSGRLRKTAFKLFGGRRSMCALPSLFGGRSKSHGKDSSKKGKLKTRTQDSMDKVSWDDARKAGDVPTGDFEYHPQNLRTTKTVESLINDPEGTHCAKGECSHLLTLDINIDKSLSFPRPKRGLKGFLSSFKHHRKNKKCNVEKTEAFEMYVGIPKGEIVSVCECKNQSDVECKSDLEKPNVLPSGINNLLTYECADDDTECVSKTVQDNTQQLKAQAPKCSHKEIKADLPNSNEEQLITDDPLTHLSDANFVSTEKKEPDHQAADQISLFEEVSSLKSFDSLTGCGDITADQDGESMSENCMSGERNRNAGKRNSCWVTYQGGGEEMAVPYEVDGDFLQNIMESSFTEDVCYPTDHKTEFLQPDARLEQMSGYTPVISLCGDAQSSPTNSHDFHNTVLTPVEKFSPQSDHQMSVPNSDEGYYDSNTPGADENEDDGIGGIGSEKLPRDSYSGDALYELFEIDNGLISPTLVEDSSRDTQKQSSDALELLGMKIHSNYAKLHSSFTSPSIDNDPEPARPVTIHHKLTNSEQHSNKNEFPEQVVGTDIFGFERTSIKPLLKSYPKDEQICLKTNSISSKSPILDSTKNLEAHFCDGVDSHQETEISVLEVHHLNVPVVYEHDENGQQPMESCQNRSIDTVGIDSENNKTIFFSQALVDFTKHTQFLKSACGDEDSESNSPFAQNMQVLPTIVTFDVVDMENEGEYDHQVQIPSDEEVSSPFEDYNEECQQKDTLGKCDGLFEFGDHSHLTHSWGVASLPRHFSLTRVDQPGEAPLFFNRRSRSLNTDSLNIEETDTKMTEPNVSPSLNLALRAEESLKMISLYCRSNGNSARHERKEKDFKSASWKQDKDGTIKLPDLDLNQKKRDGQGYGPNGSLETPWWKISPEVSECALLAKKPFDSVKQKNEQLTESTPSSEQCSDCMSPHQSTVVGFSSETVGDGASVEADSECQNNISVVDIDFSRHPKVKPVGVTQGTPHYCIDNCNTVSTHYKENTTFKAKTRQSVDVVLPGYFPKHAL